MDNNRNKRTSQPQLIRLVLLLAGILLAISFISLSWTDGDEGRYTALAHSIASGHGQSLSFLPCPTPEWLSPPLYPYALGLVFKISGSSVLALKLVSLVCYVAALWLFIIYVQRQFPQTPCMLIAISIVGFCGVFLLAFTWQILSETMFLLNSMLVLLLFQSEKVSIRQALATGITAGLSMLIRPVGIALIGAGIFHYLVRRKYNLVAIFLAAALAVNLYTIIRTQLVIGVPFAYMAHYQNYETMNQTGGTAINTLRSIIALLPQYLYVLPDKMFFSLFSNHALLSRLHLAFLTIPIKGLILLLILLGFCLRLRRPSVTEFYWVFYWFLMSTYNQPNYLAQNQFLLQDRYLLCMIPLAALFLFKGWQYATTHLPFINIRTQSLIYKAGLTIPVVYVLLTSATAGFLRTGHELQFKGRGIWDTSRLEQSRYPADHALAAYMNAAYWAKNNLPTNAVIASRKPEHTFLISQRRSFRYDGVDVPGTSIWDTITIQQQYGPAFILQDAFPSDTGYGRDRISMLDPLIENRKDQLELLYESSVPTTRIWQVRIESKK